MVRRLGTNPVDDLPAVGIENRRLEARAADVDRKRRRRRQSLLPDTPTVT